MSLRLQLKMLLDDIVRDSDRTELCMLLATLLSWTAIVRALIEQSDPHLNVNSSMPQRKDPECDEELLDDLLDEEGP